jgi:hydrocephalus-inducing protein
LCGEAERPVCHFEYPSVVDDNGKQVLQFQCLGLKSTCVKKFYVINPTQVAYEYTWRPVSSTLKENSDKCYFRCFKNKSTVYAGKKSEIRFEFCPKSRNDRKVEEYWEFKISHYNLTRIFHFIGVVLEPKIFFNNARADFGPLLLDGKGKEVIKLKNFDNIPYNFSFSKASLKGPNSKHHGCLSVHPMRGTVPPNEESLIHLEFIPKHERSYNYNLQCCIEERAEPLGLNVKGTGYKLHHVLATKEGKVLSSKEPNLLDFGEIFIKEEKTHVLTISNTGDFNFDFIIRKKENISDITITPETSTGIPILPFCNF